VQLSRTEPPAVRPPTQSRESALRRRRGGRLLAVLVVVGAALGGAAIVAGGHPSKHGRPLRPTRSSSPAPAACGGTVPSPHRPQTFAHAPHFRLPARDFGAVIHTSCGDIKLDLLERTAPKTVANFVYLALHHFYDGRKWFRVENNAVIQTGDPNDLIGSPPDGPGYTIPDELPKKPRVYVFGVVAMANTGQPDSGGSQFFIVIHHNEPAGYDPRYSVFGKVDPSSYEVLDRIGEQETYDGNDPIKSVTPVSPIYINAVEITS
jgi:cyclophilin family peptidyl-prolyl cis-trans isomerase